MNKNPFKLTASIILFSLGSYCFAQKTFNIDKKYLQTYDFNNYKSFIVFQEFEINFIGQNFTQGKRFTPNYVDLKETENAIKTQYYDANIRQLNEQWRRMEAHKEYYDWDIAVKQNKESRQINEKAFKKAQEKGFNEYDRYFFGYINAIGQKNILIRFDPHKIKYFTMSGEQQISNLPIMVYNLKTHLLNLSGWDNN